MAAQVFSIQMCTVLMTYVTERPLLATPFHNKEGRMYCPHFYYCEYRLISIKSIYMYIFHLISLPCSGVAPPKTGLQWQQPFLELVLACMHAQSTTHDELLGPLKTQLSTFLVAFEKVASTCIVQE